MRKISLVICCRNGGSKLSNVLKSISTEEMLEADGELVLVNSASTDETPTIMRRFQDESSFPVIVVDAKMPGAGRARMLGTQAASSEVIAFVDGDCYLEEGYLSKAANIFDNQSYRYCGGRILLFDENDLGFTVNYSNEFMFIPPRTCIKSGLISGGNLVVHREVFEKIGSFNPHLGRGAKLPGEDMVFIGRASMNGFAGAYVPSLTVYHHHGRQTDSEIERAMKRYDIGRGVYYMSMITQGHFKYIIFWIKTTLVTIIFQRRNNFLSMPMREIFGACRYLLFMLRKQQEHVR